ncbi:hypothetical protein EP7_003032 [Isosphaeraceae bacterium EP7]
MTTMIDDVRTQARPSAAAPAAERLRATMAAARVSFTWMGTRKALSADQNARAAEAFGAEGRSLSAGKKLLDTGHEAFRAVTAIRGRIDAYWKGVSLPFPEPGVRLVRHADLEDFAAAMAASRAELDAAVAALDRRYAGLVAAARLRLGTLFDAADYPASLAGLFAVEWSFPSVEPPEYLAGLCPGLYEAERARASARFEEAVQLAERAFAEEFARLVEHLCERLEGRDGSGQPKVFRDSAVEGLSAFFGRFRALNVSSDAQLEELVARAQRLVGGVSAQDLRDGDGLRRRVAEGLGRVGQGLDGLLADRPRRRIVRSTASSATGEA